MVYLVVDCATARDGVPGGGLYCSKRWCTWWWIVLQQEMVVVVTARTPIAVVKSPSTQQHSVVTGRMSFLSLKGLFEGKKCVLCGDVINTTLFSFDSTLCKWGHEFFTGIILCITR